MSSLNREQWQRLRGQLAGQSGPAYWRSLEELAGDEAFTRLLADEFPGHDSVWAAPIDRRRVLKLMAASLALGGLTACDSQPPERLVPYVDMPEGLVPGQPRYYATTHPIDGYAHGVLAQSREGRPVKLEGNPDHPATRGACDIFSQASVLSLYDPDRASSVMERGHITGYNQFLAALREQRGRWDASRGAGLAFLTGPITSPSQAERLRNLLTRWPEARWYRHTPVDRSAVYTASRWLFGAPREPIYRFDQARVVVSLDANFLQEQPGFLRYARDFSQYRRPRDNDELLRLYMLESTPSITGSMAEHRLLLRHTRIIDAARQLANAFALDVPPPEMPVIPDDWLAALVADLRHLAPAALVIPGDQQPPEVHALAHAINAQLGAFGTTLEIIDPVEASHGARPLDALSEAMHADEIQSLVMLDTNPVYSAPVDLKFAQALQKVAWRCHWGDTFNETARLCHWHVPATHPLETWGDARAFDGTLSLLQPLILPMHDGKTALQFLAALQDAIDHDARDLLINDWQARHWNRDFETFWRTSLRDGLVSNSAFTPYLAKLVDGWHERLPAPTTHTGGLMLQLRPDPSLWDGRYANNAWLQELPRPLTKLTWDSALLIAPVLAERRNLATGDMVRVNMREHSLEVPVYVLPGMPADAVTLTLGGGRHHAGSIADGVGANAHALQPSDSPWAVSVILEKTDAHRRLATTQNHHAIEGRDLIRVATLDTYRSDPHFAQREEPHGSLYPEPWPAERKSRHAWGMSIDLSACIGCNACVTACQAENNIPVVGADEVKKGREMHWIRIDRYFQGPLDGPEMVFQPVTCMHCENAPCEYVCPVGATQHSADGLNEMIYNRCIGTRYCSQNCPYKVRRFNWFHYTGETATYQVPAAAHNPDVTVRSRGVMEKCTYCVQRINRKQRDAETEERELADGELQTACQQACPTQAIVFGDLNDSASEVSRLKAHPLDYGMLAHLNVRPRTTYLAAVRAPNPRVKNSSATSSGSTSEVGTYTPKRNAPESLDQAEASGNASDSRENNRVFFREEPS
ncbi:TAT-variant-translocated molybdopterin oxidoreductase [Litchfieldella rifensis]|uniref:TAT-variant-translocated molybdopterin oxidoreductase n=1 Tax=Litchfieldella rifensis TaxID=762643 RepID=A0ABV7LLX3_9GAMM